MKKLKLFFALFAMLALGVGNAWGAEETVSWTATTNSLGSAISNVNGTATGTIKTGDFVWNYTRTLTSLKSGKTDYVQMSNGYMQCGSSNAINSLEFQTSNIPGTIKSVAVDCASYQGKHNISITVGGTTYLAKTAVPTWSSNTGGVKTGTGTSSGEIIISFTDGTRALYIKSITIVYEETSGSGSTEPVASLTANPTSLDFGNVTQNNEVEAKTFTISGSDFTTGKLTITAPSGYTVNPTTVSVDGTLEETTITVTPNTSTVGPFNGNVTISGANLKSSVNVALSMTVEKAPATPTENVYVKVTSTAGITDGEYLIVYEDASNATPPPVAFDGSLTTLDAVSNNIAVTITDGTIAGNTDIDAATFTIDVTAGTIKSASGYYIGKTASGNGLNTDKTTAYTNTITIDADKNAVVTSSGGSILRYNNASNQARFRYYGSGQQAIALYKKASKHTVTIADCTNGSVSAKMGETALATNDQVLSGIQITLSNEAATNYKLAAYDVYKTDDATTKVTVTDGKFIMPEFDVTISATFELAKTLTSIEITTPATQTTFWQGETFNHNGLKVTAHFDGAEDEDVTDKVTVTGSTATAGAAVEVTVSFTEGTTTETTEYDITVKATANTKETAYDVTTAREIIDKVSTADNVYVTGIVSQIVTPYNSEYGNITYNISADGTTNADQLQAYRGKSYNGANFTSADDVKVGDEVVIKGTLKKYSTTYEFDENNQLVSLNRTKEQAGLAYEETELTANVGEEFTEPTLTNPNSLSITYSSSNTTLATVNATTGEVTILAAGKVTITASTTGNASYAAGSASYNITISNPAMAVATLPFTFNSGKADIENTAGMTQEGLGSDYSASTAPNSQLKFGDTGVWVVIRFDSEPEKLSYDIKNNSFSGGTFSVQESADGETYTDVKVHTEITGTQSEEHTLSSASRYVKFIYTEKVDGNVGLGNIKITKFGEEPEQPGGGETPEERLTDWVLTSAADITINDLVVITMTKGETTWAMSNDNGTSAAPAAPVVTLSADALAAEPAENLKWVVSNDNGTLTIYPYGDYETWLYCTNTNNGVRVGNGGAKEFTIDTDHLYTTLTTDSRYLGVYDGANWRCYTSINSNIEDQTLAFYVKKNANDVLPGTGEDPEEPGDDPVVPTPTINPTATFIFNTAEGLNDLGITYPVTPTTTVEDGTEDAFKTEFENNAKFTQDGITMTTTGGGTPTRVWLTAAGKLDLRVYRGATLTFSVPAEHQISKVVFDGSNIGHLLVNETAVSGNAWTGSAQTITFIAKADASTIKINTIAFVVEYTRNVTNKYGSICLPYASASTSGAYFYEVVGKGTENSKPAVYLASVNTLKAGVPYIFEKTANTIKVVYSSEKEDTPQNANGLIGTFEEITVPDGDYILYNDAFRTNEPAGSLNKIRAYRAYLDLSAVEGGKLNQMPGRRYIGMSVQGENVETGIEDLFTTDAPVKVIENGQLIIIRDGVKYNVQGQKL